MRLDERLQAELERLVDELREGVGLVEDRQEQHEVRTRRAQQVELSSVDDELLGQHRDGDRGADRAKVLDRPAEPMRLAQHRDRGRATRLVGPRPRDQVLVAPPRSARPTARIA